MRYAITLLLSLLWVTTALGAQPTPQHRQATTAQKAQPLQQRQVTAQRKAPLEVAAQKKTELQRAPSDRLVSSAQYQRLVRQRAIAPIALAQRKGALQQRDRDTRQAVQFARSRLSKAPQVLQRIDQKPDRRKTKVRSDGTIETRIRTRSGPNTRVLLGQAFAARSLARSLEQGSSVKTQQALYRTLHAQLAKRSRDGKVADRRLISRIAKVDRNGRIRNRGRDLSNVQLVAQLNLLIGHFQDNPPEPAPEPWAPTLPCDQEEYYGDGTDGANGNWPTFNSQGLFANVDWPLKQHITCVKNQGRRGSCVAFALTAATETRVSVQTNRKVNLSEQELYNTQKMAPLSLPPNCGDGLTPVFELVGLTLAGYEFAKEKDWDYNPSLSREDAPLFSAECYINSCNGYSGGACSNTNHQARRVCETGFFGESCGYEDPLNGDTDIQIESFATFLNPFDAEGSLDQAIALLNAQVPVLLSFGVHESFDDTPSTGYTSIVSGPDNFRGNHASVLVGYVPNSQRPAGVSAAAGGGYFVLKNSWGTGVADRGFYYLPYNYVRDKALALDAIHSVEI